MLFQTVIALSVGFRSNDCHTPLYPFVTNGVATVIRNHGSEAQKKLFVEPLRTGRWFGVMAMSETQAGSSVGDLKTEALPTDAGHYLITGSKMWITGAAQDFTENIVHLVLAPDCRSASRNPWDLTLYRTEVSAV